MTNAEQREAARKFINTWRGKAMLLQMDILAIKDKADLLHEI